MEIKDGAFSILSIFPIARKYSDDKKFFAAIEQACSKLTSKYSFIRKERICATGSTGCKNECFRCSCFDAVDSFLGGDRDLRIYLGTTYLRWCEKALRMDIFLKIIPMKNVGIVDFNFIIDGYHVQEVIALRHTVESNPPGQKTPNWESCYSSLNDLQKIEPLRGPVVRDLFMSLIQDIQEEMPQNNRIIEKSEDVLVNEIVSSDPMFKLQTIMELRSIGDFAEWDQNAHLWAEKNVQTVYGLITGDEGIGFIPDEFAKNRISEHWGSRDFFDAIAIKTNVLLLNSKTTSEMGHRYMDYQRDWNNRFNGGEGRLQYFTGKPCIAGFDHGILNAVERNMVIRFYYDFIDHQGKSSERKLNKQRQKLLSFISSSLSSIDEINELYNTISRASNTDSSISRIRNRLDIQSEEMNIDYQYRNNDVIYVLTVLSLTIAIFAIQRSDNLFVGFNELDKVLLLIGTLLGCIVVSITSTVILRWVRKKFNR